MKKQIPIVIDVTPWSRGPHTGVGLTAHLSFEAVRQSLFNNKIDQSCFELHGVTRFKTSASYSHLSLFRRYWGWKRGIFHSFELKLLPVKHSKKVITVHDLWSITPNPFQSVEFQSIQGPKLKRAIETADHIAVPSSHVRDQIKFRFPNINTPISVVPWGPTVQVRETPPDNNEIKTYLSKKRPYLLCVATFETRKNYELLLNSISPSLAKEVDLVTVGQTGYGGETSRAKLASMRQQSLGGLDLKQASSNDLQSLYSHCLGLILVSHDEGFGIPVLEALAFGKPIIASDLPSLREIAGNRAQYISKDQGTQGLSEAISKLISQTWRSEDITLSKQRASHFTWQVTAQKNLEIYRSLADF